MSTAAPSGLCPLTRRRRNYRPPLWHFPFRMAGISLSSSQAPVAEWQPAAHSSLPPASSSADGTADCVSLHPCRRKTFGTSHRCFSSWFVTDSVVSQQSACTHTQARTHADTYERTHAHDKREDIKRVGCEQEDPQLVSPFSLLVAVCS